MTSVPTLINNVCKYRVIFLSILDRISQIESPIMHFVAGVRGIADGDFVVYGFLTFLLPERQRGICIVS